MGYKFFQEGKLSETLYFGDWITFESQLRKKPEIFIELPEEEKEDCYYDTTQNNVYNLAYGVNRKNVINDFFVELGIYLPACYPVKRDRNFELAVENNSNNTIERVDAVTILLFNFIMTTHYF